MSSSNVSARTRKRYGNEAILMQSVPANVVIPPETKSVIESVCDDFADYFLDELIQNKTWKRQNLSIKAEDIYLTLQRDPFNVINVAFQQDNPNDVPELDLQSVPQSNQTTSKQNGFNEHLLEDSNDIHPFFLKKQ